MTQFERKQMSCFGVWHISPFLTFSRDSRVCVNGSAIGFPQIVFGKLFYGAYLFLKHVIGRYV